MAQLKDLADKRENLMFFDPRRLKIKPGLNGRDFTLPENIAHVEELAISIEEKGVIEPLKIFRETDDDIFIANGESRWRACMLLIERGVDVKMVPCLPEPRGTNDKDRLLNQIVSNSGKPFTALEVGGVIKRHLALGGTIGEIAKTLGKSASWVSQLVDFQAAPAEVHDAVKAGEISATLAAKITREEGPKAIKTVKSAITTRKHAARPRRRRKT